MSKIKEKLFIVVITVVGLSFTVFKLHQSSVGFYKPILSIYKDTSLILFTPRGIRSDEWLVGTAKLVSQVQHNKLQPSTKLVGFLETLPVMSGVPYYHWKSLFHPHTLPFFFLPLEYAFALSWWVGPLIMILASYLIAKLLTKSEISAVFVSLIFFFTPFNQWWTNTLSGFLGYGGMAVYFFLTLISEKKVLNKILRIIGLIYFFLCFVFILYPPFQASIGLFFLFLVIGFLVQSRKKLDAKKRITLLMALGITLLVSGGVILLFYTEFKDILQIIQNTAYPGKRVVTGGGYDWMHLLNGFYNIQLLDDIKGAGPWGNQSEASNFLLLYPYGFCIYLYFFVKQVIKRKVNWLLACMLFYLLLATVWLFIPFPLWISKITLLYLIPPNRMLIGIGVADVYLTFYFLTKIHKPKGRIYLIVSLFFSIIAFFVNLYMGFYLNQNYPLFIQNKAKIVLISIVAGASVYLFLQQKKILFPLFIFIYLLLSTYRVNPIYRGLDALVNTPFAKKIQLVELKNKQKYRWVTYDSLLWGQYSIANGVRSLSGVYLYPQFDLWKNFDSQEKYKDTWNRYAHVFFSYDQKEKNKFVLLQPDLFKININPCSEELKKLKVKYYIMMEKKEYVCLKEMQKFKTWNSYLYIYERTD